MPYDSNGVWSLTPGYLAITGQVVSPTNHNPPLEDISTNGLSAVMVRDGRAPATGNWSMGNFKIGSLANGTLANDAVNKSQLDAAVGFPVQYVAQTLTAAQQAQARSNISAALKGQLFGLNISNNSTDSANDFDIAAGEAASEEANPVLMVLASAITKRVDAAWTVGTGNGGMDTGSINTGTVHIWLIQRSDTGVVDVLFSASATAPTMPTNYDRKRRIGSIPRNAGTNYGVTQIGDDFYHKGPPNDGSFADPGISAILRTLTVPSGIVVTAIINVFYDGASGSSSALLITSPSQNDQSPGTGSYTFFTAATGRVSGQIRCATNTSAQIRARLSLSNASTTYAFVTNGWTDTRGRV